MGDCFPRQWFGGGALVNAAPAPSLCDINVYLLLRRKVSRDLVNC